MTITFKEFDELPDASYDSKGWIEDFTDKIKAADFAEDYEDKLREDDFRALNALLNQYFNDTKPAAKVLTAEEIHKRMKQLKDGIQDALEAIAVLQRSTNGGAPLLEALLGSEVLDRDLKSVDSYIESMPDPIEIMQHIHDRLGNSSLQLTSKVGAKSDPAFEVLVRRLFRFWQDVVSRKENTDSTPDIHSFIEETSEAIDVQSKISSRNIYQLIQGTLKLIGIQREEKSLRNLVPADSFSSTPSRHWVPKEVQ